MRPAGATHSPARHPGPAQDGAPPSYDLLYTKKQVLNDRRKKADQTLTTATMKFATTALVLLATSTWGVVDAASFDFVARHYFPAGYEAGTTEGVPDQYVASY